MAAGSNFFNPVSQGNTMTARDIFGVTYDSTVEIFEAITKIAAAGEDGTVNLPTGQTIDVTTLSGMTTYTTYLQFLQAHKELIDNVFVFIKNLENKLDNLLSS
jgi:hypothetical protein